ncbi:MAG: hypothetical protein QME87_09960 [Bacillota bacterium]|nr:hypothetical protein [Bacillota bacterium]
MDVACYRLLEAESRVRRYLREARRSAGLDCGSARVPVYPWMRLGGRPQQVASGIEGRQ